MPQAESLTVRVSIELIPAIAEAINSDAALTDAVLTSVANQLSALQRELGLTAQLGLRIVSWPEAQGDVRWMRVRVSETLCRYADDLLPRIQSHVEEMPLRSRFTTPDVLDWLTTLINSKDSTQRSKIAEFIGLACRAITARDPRPMLPPDQQLPTSRSVLEQLLALRISIAGVDSAMKRLPQNGHPPTDEDLAERLIAILRPDAIEIQVPRDDLHLLTASDPEHGRKAFSKVRDELFETLGMTFPDFRFIPSADLKRGSCRFRLNHVSGAPWPTISPNSLLVDLEPRALAMNPVSGRDSTVLALSAREQLNSGVPSSWNALEYLALCLRAELQENTACFVDTSTASDYLKRIDDFSPVLVSAVRASKSEECLSRTLRNLVAENVSIRDVHSILNRVLDFDFIVIDEQSRFVFDGRLPIPAPPSEKWIKDARPLAAFIRSGLRPYLTDIHSDQKNEMFVYLLDADLEGAFAAESLEPGFLKEEYISTILFGVHEALRKRPPDNSPDPIVLTTAAASEAMRRIIAPEFPKLPVLTYTEISPSTTIRVLTSITVTRSSAVGTSQ